MKKQIILLLSFHLFLCSILISTVRATEPGFALISNNQDRVTFPHYVKYLSTLFDSSNSHQTQLSKSELQKLKTLVELMPDVVKTPWGVQANVTLNTKTQFDLTKFNQLVESKARELGWTQEDLSSLIQSSDTLKITFISNALSHCYFNNVTSFQNKPTRPNNHISVLQSPPPHYPSIELHQSSNELSFIENFIEYGI